MIIVMTTTTHAQDGYNFTAELYEFTSVFVDTFNSAIDR